MDHPKEDNLAGGKKGIQRVENDYFFWGEKGGGGVAVIEEDCN
jgi:hypothetical protein